MVWLGSTTQLSKKYTTGTPSDTRYCARFPKVSDELLDTVHVPVKPVSHPFSSSTGGRVAPDGTVCLGFTTIANVVTRSSPASLVAESLPVYSPGFVRGGAASSTRSWARFGPATRALDSAPSMSPSIARRRFVAFSRKSSVSGGAAICTDSPTRISERVCSTARGWIPAAWQTAPRSISATTHRELQRRNCGTQASLWIIVQELKTNGAPETRRPVFGRGAGHLQSCGRRPRRPFRVGRWQRVLEDPRRPGGAYVSNRARASPIDTVRRRPDRAFVIAETGAQRDTDRVFLRGRFVERRARGGDAKRLTTAPGVETDPVFSPDGSTIAFTGEYDGNVAVFVMTDSCGAPEVV